jgi:hypothetical protein
MCPEYITIKSSHVKLKRFIGYHDYIKVFRAICTFLILIDGIKIFQSGKLCSGMLFIPKFTKFSQIVHQEDQKMGRTAQSLQ